MQTYHICTTPDEKNERLLLSGKIPDTWKTSEEIQKEAWIYLRLQQAKEKLTLSPNDTDHEVYLQKAYSLSVNSVPSGLTIENDKGSNPIN